MQSANEYEHAFENWLGDNGIKYVYVDQSRRKLFGREKLKTFDFLLYPAVERGPVIIAEIKGKLFKGDSLAGLKGMQNWVGTEDVRGMMQWQQRLGSVGRFDYTRAVFVFVYKFANIDVENDGNEIYDFDGNSYAFFCVELKNYVENMKLRSSGWHTVSLPSNDFRKQAFPLRELLAPDTIKPYRVCY